MAEKDQYGFVKGDREGNVKRLNKIIDNINEYSKAIAAIAIAVHVNGMPVSTSRVLDPASRLIAKAQVANMIISTM